MILLVGFLIGCMLTSGIALYENYEYSITDSGAKIVVAGYWKGFDEGALESIYETQHDIMEGGYAEFVDMHQGEFFSIEDLLVSYLETRADGWR